MKIWKGSLLNNLRLEAEQLFFGNKSLDIEFANPKLKYLSKKCRGDCKVKLGIFSNREFHGI